MGHDITKRIEIVKDTRLDVDIYLEIADGIFQRKVGWKGRIESKADTNKVRC